jgi:N-acetylmuramoyl-L-alanine amidase
MSILSNWNQQATKTYSMPRWVDILLGLAGIKALHSKAEEEEKPEPLPDSEPDPPRPGFSLADRVKIYVDPGHRNGTPNSSPEIAYKPPQGPWDRIGIEGTYRYWEWKGNLYRANKLVQALNDEGIEAVLTRDDTNEPGPPKEGRSEFQRRVDACNLDDTDKFKIFLSLHSNAGATGDWHKNDGAMLLIWKGSRLGKIGARAFSPLFLKYSKQRDLMYGHNYIERDDLFVLKHTNCPAFLLEVADHTTREGVEKLKSLEWNADCVLAIIAGLKAMILNYVTLNEIQ